jgi:CDP-6-deoxy-D-xylo-4-hexulose-3-dehydrase
VPGASRPLNGYKLILFGGNLIRQPAFVHLRQAQPVAFQVIGELSGSDEMMTDTLFLGSYPVLTTEMIETEIAVIRWFCSQL